MLLYIISALVIIGIAVYVIALYKGKIKDEDKDFIPDAIEEGVKEIFNYYNENPQVIDKTKFLIK